MEKLAIQLASVASMIDQFNMPNIQILQSLGYKVDVVADFTNPGTITKERADGLRRRLEEMGVQVYDIAIPRSLNPLRILKAFRQVKSLLNNKNYNLLHCHSPIGGVIARAAAKRKRKAGLKVIYTAHGFHFFDGAPIKNWMVFYPIEKHYSRYTDVLITINKEDYKRATEKFYAQKTAYIPGVGVDTEKFSVCKVDSCSKRLEIGVDNEAFLMLSVIDSFEGCPIISVLDSLAKLKIDGLIGNIVYLVVGPDSLYSSMKQTIEKYGLENHVKTLGVRNDLGELCEIANCYVDISKDIEAASFEAMAAGLPFISLRSISLVDYNEIRTEGCNIESADIASSIIHLRDDLDFRANCGSKSIKAAKHFDIKNCDCITKNACNDGYRHLQRMLIRQEIREELGLSLDDFVIISVGELNDNKNHQVIIKAMEDLPLHFKYVLVGKGPLDAYLKALVRDKLSDRVVFTGFRTDVRNLLYSADCFAFPSKREGLGLAALEGMAVGLPVIGHDIGGIRDFVNDETGWLCKKDKEYKEAILKCESRAETYAYACTNKAREFDISKTDSIMRGIYNSNE